MWGCFAHPHAGGGSFADPVGARKNDIFIYIIVCMYVFMYVTRSDRNKSGRVGTSRVGSEQVGSVRNKSGRFGTSRFGSEQVGSVRFASRFKV